MTEHQPKPGKQEHPLIGKKLPDWLIHVPISPTSPTIMHFGEERKRVPIDLVVNALAGRIGQGHYAFTISSELAQLFAEHTENPGWKHLPAETTSVTRIEEDSWEVRIGDYKERFTREELERRVIETLLPPEDENPTAN